MKKIKYYVLLCLISILFVMCMSGCGKEPEVPQLTADLLEEIASGAIKQEIYFDQISNFTFEQVETSEEDMEALKKVFTQKVPYQTVHCTANISSISMDAYVEYNIVIAYDNVQWKAIHYYSVNEGNWEYDAKEFVALKEIMNDLKKVDVGPFKAGYCGDEKKSTLTINDRVEDEKINRETIYCTLTIDTDFGYYEVDMEAIYYFKKGKWVIGDFVIPDVHEWKFTYDEDNEIKLFNEEYIKGKLNTKNEFLTYIVNPKYIKEDAIILEGMTADTETVTYNYTYNVIYENIGEVNYSVNIEYEWLSFEWSEGLFSIDLKSQDLSGIKDTKYISGNRYFTIDKVEDYTEDITLDEGVKVDEKSQFVNITYFNGEEKYDLFCNLLVVLRDNNYELRVLDITKNGQDVKRFTEFDKIILDVNKNALSINEQYFYICESSELLNMKFINENDNNQYFYIEEINTSQNDEIMRCVYFDGEKEIIFDSKLIKNNNSWTGTITIEEQEYVLTIYDDNPYFILFEGNNFYTQEIIDLKNQQKNEITEDTDSTESLDEENVSDSQELDITEEDSQKSSEIVEDTESSSEIK